jgi:CRP-like cAMP-binding protein
MTKVHALKRLPVANHLLAAVPRPEYQRLLPDLEAVTLRSGEVLYEPGQAIRHVYFPHDSLVSLLLQTEGNRILEIGLVGRDGMLGIQLALGSHYSQVCARVQETGTALRMECAHFRRELTRCAPLQRELHRYINEWMAQISQNAACHRFHPVEARLARRLLITRDHRQSNEFQLTQELLANMLGVLRVAVTKAAGALQRRKLISYRRGEISILDGRGLEAAACHCYQIDAGEDVPAEHEEARQSSIEELCAAQSKSISP